MSDKRTVFILRGILSGVALIFSITLAVDMTMFALRRNYGFDVGAVRGFWFGVGAALEFIGACACWATALTIESRGTQ